MKEIKKILAPSDLSELSKTGVRYAVELAEVIRATVTLYHAVDYDILTRHGQRSTAPDTFQPPDEHFVERYKIALAKFLMDCLSTLASSVKVDQKVELGNPDTSIVELAKAEAYDLIVMSTHGKTGFRMSVGSVTEKVVQTAPCPVLSIRPQHAQR
jgi:nucleotide-binding universal stress UspA family protein